MTPILTATGRPLSRSFSQCAASIIAENRNKSLRKLVTKRQMPERYFLQRIHTCQYKLGTDYRPSAFPRICLVEVIRTVPDGGLCQTTWNEQITWRVMDRWRDRWLLWRHSGRKGCGCELLKVLQQIDEIFPRTKLFVARIDFFHMKHAWSHDERFKSYVSGSDGLM